MSSHKYRAMAASAVVLVLIVALAAFVISQLKNLQNQVTVEFSQLHHTMQMLDPVHSSLKLVGTRLESSQAFASDDRQRLLQRIGEYSDTNFSGISTELKDITQPLEVSLLDLQSVLSSPNLGVAQIKDALADTNAVATSVIGQLDGRFDQATKSSDHVIDNMLQAIYWGVPPMTLFFVILAWNTIRLSTSGISALTAACEQLAKGDLSQRDPANYDSEIRPVIDSINTLGARIAEVTTSIDHELQRMAQGHFDARVENRYGGAYGTLVDAVNRSIAEIERIVTGIREVAVEVRNGATEIAQGNIDLSHRTEEQASSLEETASTIKGLSQSVDNNATLASDADQLAHQAQDNAEAGSRVLKDSMTAMDDIRAASDKISEIINVINDIAFQTNLLALNASVEAARAGEQGLGFGVVANEVRNLAQRSAEAAKQIERLIADTHKKVRYGVDLVNQSGQMLVTIEHSNRRVCELVASISHSTKEQSTGFGEISRAIHDMDMMTQQNAALVEQAAAASKTMEGQALQLNELIQNFGQRAVVARVEPTSSLMLPPTPRKSPSLAIPHKSKPVVKSVEKPKTPRPVASTPKPELAHPDRSFDNMSFDDFSAIGTTKTHAKASVGSSSAPDPVRRVVNTPLHTEFDEDWESFD
ncbi:MAG: HAMP domain-containing protein [Gammaproteobacteria bacterium]|nr:HAMP domain-containing protein [Gammaproteobacteria bacterium]